MTGSSPTRRMRATKGIAFLVGLAAVAVAVFGWRVAPAAQHDEINLRVELNQTGELGVVPSGRVLADSNLGTGDTASTSVTITNQTGEPVDLRLRALPQSPDLDHVLVVELRTGGVQIFSGDLGELRTWTNRGPTLAPGVPTTVELSVSRSGAGGYSGPAQFMLELAHGDRVVDG